jgi:hypothetical protein
MLRRPARTGHKTAGEESRSAEAEKERQVELAGTRPDRHSDLSQKIEQGTSPDDEVIRQRFAEAQRRFKGREDVPAPPPPKPVEPPSPEAVAVSQKIEQPPPPAKSANDNKAAQQAAKLAGTNRQ